VTVEHDRAIFRCWHCERDGMVMLDDMKPAPPPTPVSKAVKNIRPTLSVGAVAYLKTRGISADVAALWGIQDADAFFPDLRRETRALAFPYFDKGKPWGFKLRSIEDKAHACSRALKTFFGAHLLDLSEDKHIVICEGEFDAVSFYIGEVMNAVSVPNGASSFGKNDTKDTHSFLWADKEAIERAEKIIIATDNDEKGQDLAEEIARRIGRHKCWKVEWPEGCKDANDVLLKHGKEGVNNLVKNAIPWPIAGLYEATRFFPEVVDLYKNGLGEKIRTGIKQVDELYSVGKGLLTVITGIPGNGKSTFVDQLMINLARMRGYRTLICSFENPPKVHIAKLAEMLLQKHYFDREIYGTRMTERELYSTFGFINEHFKFMHQDDGAKATIDSIIERIKTAVLRWGINCAVVDPYNYIERGKDNESETSFIDDVLTRLRLLASVYDLHIWFVAHPTKLPMDHEGQHNPPRGYQISGSGAWYSKADFGLTVHRAGRDGEVKIINWKTRFNWLGKEGETIILYDQTRSVYLSDIHADLLPWEEG
jgi:twinkle protein